MKERPIPFTGAMVRALLAGTKTQTRRLVALPRTRSSFVLEDHRNGWWPYQSDDGESSLCGDGMEHPYASPYGQPGDRLWVREAWHAPLAYDLTPPRDIPPGTPVVFRADGAGSLPHFNSGKLRQGMFMPRWASRLTLDVTEVRVERLQDISEADARAEGCEPQAWCVEDPKDLIDWPLKDAAHPYRNGYALLWEQINGTGSWAANPWVWVVEFREVSR